MYTAYDGHKITKIETHKNAKSYTKWAYTSISIRTCVYIYPIWFLRKIKMKGTGIRTAKYQHIIIGKTNFNFQLDSKTFSKKQKRPWF